MPQASSLSSPIVLGWTQEVTGIAAIIIGAFVAWAVYRRTVPRRELRWSAEVIPLLPRQVTRSYAEHITVSVGPHVMHSPSILTLKLRSVGRADIPSSAFDGGKALPFDVGAAIRVQLDRTGLSASDLTLKGSEIGIKPMLIKSGKRMTVQVITEGFPLVRYDGSLYDANVCQEGQRRRKGLRRAITAFYLICLIVALVGGFDHGLTAVMTKILFPLVLAAFGGDVVIPVTMFVSRVVRGRRLLRR
jgi:hypothetical protein